MARKKIAPQPFRSVHPDITNAVSDLLEVRKSVDTLTAALAVLVMRIQDEPGAGEEEQKETYLTAPQVAERLGITKQGVYGMVSRKVIPFCKVGQRVRFAASDIDRWMRERGNYGREGV